MIRIIKNKKEWCQELASTDEVDFYHTYHYHHLSKHKDEVPVLIKYTEGNTSLVLPLLLRPIKNSEFKDAVSVYGYVGILALHIDENFNKEHFHEELKTCFKELQIVSVFSRLHPYVKHQESLLEGIGTISSLGKVVYIDLSDTLENQRKMFNRRMKTYLNKSRTTCTIIESKEEKDIGSFIHLYHENMKRVDADDDYYFNESYFHQLIESEEFTTRLLLCIHNETQAIIGGALFIEKGNIIQYHLSGLDDEYYDLNAVKLIIDEMRIRSSNKEFKFFNLGGGRGSSEDSLFTFKSSFSKNFKDFKIWKYIVDEDAYKLLVEKRFGNSWETDIKNINFFPAYRSKTKIDSNFS